MPVHVKMLDKDGVGFRLITVEDPVCIQLIATDPDADGYPSLRIGHQPAPVFYYPLTNDAYVMNEAGETISKVSWKEAVREIGKAEAGMRPTRKGLTELLPISENARQAIKNLRPSHQKVLDAYAGMERLESESTPPNKPHEVEADFKFIEIEKVDDTWKLSIQGRAVDIHIFSPDELFDIRAFVAPHKFQDFKKWLKEEEKIDEVKRDQIISYLSRNIQMYEACVRVTGSGQWARETFTPLYQDPDLGNTLVCEINGVVRNFTELTPGVATLQNVFYQNPLAVKQVENDPILEAVQGIILENSTVYYFANPEARKHHSDDPRWIDYSFYPFGKPKEETKGPNLIETKFPFVSREATQIAENEILNLFIGKDVRPGEIQLCKVAYDIGLAVSESFHRLFLVYRGLPVKGFVDSRVLELTDYDRSQMFDGVDTQPHRFTWYDIFLFEGELTITEARPTAMPADKNDFGVIGQLIGGMSNKSAEMFLREAYQLLQIHHHVPGSVRGVVIDNLTLLTVEGAVISAYGKDGKCDNNNYSLLLLKPHAKEYVLTMGTGPSQIIITKAEDVDVSSLK